VSQLGVNVKYDVIYAVEYLTTNYLIVV